MLKPEQCGPFPILGDHLVRNFLVRVELSIGIGGRIDNPAELLEVLAGNFADLLATHESMGDLVEIVSCDDPEPSGLRPAPGDLTTQWTDEDRLTSYRQGWSIFGVDGTIQLQRIDDPEWVAEENGLDKVLEFPDDAEAAASVQENAEAGDATCRKAIELLVYHRSGDVKTFGLEVKWEQSISQQ